MTRGGGLTVRPLLDRSSSCSIPDTQISALWLIAQELGPVACQKQNVHTVFADLSGQLGLNTRSLDESEQQNKERDSI